MTAPRPSTGGPERGEAHVLAEGKHIRLVERNGWEYVERGPLSGIILIAAVTDDGRLVLVEQERPPVDRPVIELPAGLVGDTFGSRGESLLDGARRELVEETGYEASDWRHVARGPPSAGISTEVLDLFVATGLRKVGPGGGDDDEDILVHEVPVAVVPRWLEEQAQRGALIDLKVWAGLYFLSRGSA